MESHAAPLRCHKRKRFARKLPGETLNNEATPNQIVDKEKMLEGLGLVKHFSKVIDPCDLVSKVIDPCDLDLHRCSDIEHCYSRKRKEEHVVTCTAVSSDISVAHSSSSNGEVSAQTLNPVAVKIKGPLKSGCPSFLAMKREMRERSRDICKKFSLTLLVYKWSSVSFTIVPLMLVRLLTAAFECSNTFANQKCDPQLLYEIWWPYDTKALPTYYFINLWQILGAVILISVESSTDAFICSLMLAASERASMLARVAPQALLPGPRGVTLRFKEWVKYHQHYLRIMKRINILFGPMIFFIHFDALICIITYTFYAIDQSSNDDHNKNMAIFGMVGVLIHIYVYALAGQRIIDKSLELRQSVMAVSQRSSKGHRSFKCDLEIVLNRVTGGHVTSEQVTGLGYFTVSIITFSTILSSAFSYLVVLLRLRTPKEM